MRSSTLLVLGVAALLLLADPAEARRRGKGGKKKGKQARNDDVEEVVVTASGEVGEQADDEELGGFASPPRRREPAASSQGGGKDMSVEFAKYKSCQDCTGAGWGWCPIRRMCGGFANKDCRGDETDYRVGEEPAASDIAPASSSDWRNTEDTTRLWEIISSGNMEELEGLLEGNPELAKVRSEDGRGPLFWAYEYKQAEMADLLVRNGADATAQDRDGKNPKGIAASKPRPKRKAAPPAGGDMSAYFATLKTCSECLEAGYGWCPIRRRCGGFANRECRNDYTDTQEGSAAADSLEGFAAPPKKQASSSAGGQDMRSVFDKIKTCSDCLAQGYGWCPIRRRCGGFANRNCRGDESDIKLD